MGVHFGCTGCGKCCRDLWLPLTVEEAVAWLERGQPVNVLCEAMVWPVEPENDAVAAYKKERSFPAACGPLPIRIGMSLAAHHDGPCPNLLPDLRCRIYDARPLVCRLYPVEFNPFVVFDPKSKRCPPEAWEPSNPVLLTNDGYAGNELPDAIARFRAAAASEVGIKAGICEALGLRAASLANEGYMTYRPDPATLLDILRNAMTGGNAEERAQPADWTIVSNRKATLDMLSSVGAPCAHSGRSGAGAYLGFYPDEA